MNKIAPGIVADPKIRFGKITIKGTRITVEEALGFLAAGMNFNEIEKEYGLKKEQVLAAVRYAAALIAKKRAKVMEEAATARV